MVHVAFRWWYLQYVSAACLMVFFRNIQLSSKLYSDFMFSSLLVGILLMSRFKLFISAFWYKYKVLVFFLTYFVSDIRPLGPLSTFRTDFSNTSMAVIFCIEAKYSGERFVPLSALVSLLIKCIFILLLICIESNQRLRRGTSCICVWFLFVLKSFSVPSWFKRNKLNWIELQSKWCSWVPCHDP